MGLVDAYGPAACCDICNEEADEADLEDFGDRMACSTCRAVLGTPEEADRSFRWAAREFGNKPLQ